MKFIHIFVFSLIMDVLTYGFLKDYVSPQYETWYLKNTKENNEKVVSPVFKTKYKRLPLECRIVSCNENKFSHIKQSVEKNNSSLVSAVSFSNQSSPLTELNVRSGHGCKSNDKLNKNSYTKSNFYQPKPLDGFNKIAYEYDKNSRCNKGLGALATIGWDSGEPIIKICFNENEYITYWSRHSIREKFKGKNSPFRWNSIFNYKKLKVEDYKIVHLTSPDDFDSMLDKKATYYYENTALQYVTLQKSWKDLEDFIRTEASPAWFIYTGTLSNNRRSEPPDYFFKVITVENKGIAFIGINHDRHFIDSPCSSFKFNLIYKCEVQFLCVFVELRGTYFCKEKYTLLDI